MITIVRDETKVKVAIHLASVNFTINLSQDRGNNLDAELLKREMQSELNKRIEEIRRVSYELGWKDKASKKEKKKTYFAAGMNSNYIG